MRIQIFEAQAIREARHLSTPERVEIAEQIVADARAAAPVLTGEYQAGMAVEANGDTVAAVDNDDEAGFKEYGTADTPAHATLTNAARRYGKYSGVQPKGR
jgi:hypothetical protein